MSFLRSPVKVNVDKAHSKTGFLVKLLLIIGIILLIITIVEKFIQIFGMSETQIGSIFAFAILCFGLSGIFYYFRIQFGKLEEIMNELENEDLKDTD